MFVHRFYDDRLAQAAYLIGCQRTGEAIVIDPPRDVAPLIEAAQREGLRITKVSETHIHADFLSGAREMVAATGATAYLSAEGGEDWQYAWGKEGSAELVRHGDRIIMGGVHLTVRHTPGHTPEHIVFVVTDTARSLEPVAMVSGDFLFVGDVGRPDLLERAAGLQGTMADSAKSLFRSLQQLTDLPDHLQIWPGHGAGSACGKALGAVPSSTLGYERLTNWAFGVTDEATFVTAVLDGQPIPPAYFATMKKLNREGPAVLGKVAELPHNPAHSVDAVLKSGLLLDTRPAAHFAAGHLPGSLNIPLNRAFTTWAGSLIGYNETIHLLAIDQGEAEDARRALASIGLDRVAGWFDATALEGNPVLATQRGPVSTAKELSSHGRLLVDLRNPDEWRAGHIPGAVHHPLGRVAETLADIDRSTPLAIYCQAGGRSAIGASVLARMGFRDVVDLNGGYSQWRD